MEEEIEIWKDIVGYEGLYQVSSFGRIKNLGRPIYQKNGITKYLKVRIYNHDKPMNSKGDYHRMWLIKDNITTVIPVHRLVCSAFHPNPENKPFVNHVDCNRYNNHYKNLEWVTSKENAVHAYNNGLYIITNGELNGCHKLTNEEVLEIRKLCASNKCKQVDLAKKYGVAPVTISRIHNKTTWKHI